MNLHDVTRSCGLKQDWKILYKMITEKFLHKATIVSAPHCVEQTNIIVFFSLH